MNRTQKGITLGLVVLGILCLICGIISVTRQKESKKQALVSESIGEELPQEEDIIKEWPKWEAKVESQEGNTTILTLTRDEIPLYAILEVPELKEGETCPLVLVLHGFRSWRKSPLIQSVADDFKEMGCAVLRMDFEGHGDSGLTFQEMTVSGEIQDAAALLAYAKTLDFASDIHVVGHSMGGLVASQLAGRYPEEIRTLTLLAPAGHLKEEVQKGTFGGGDFDPENLPEQVDLGGVTLNRTYFEDILTIPVWETVEQYQGPVCIIQGTEDDKIPMETAERYHQVYEDSILHVIEDANHSYTEHLDVLKEHLQTFCRERILSSEG